MGYPMYIPEIGVPDDPILKVGTMPSATPTLEPEKQRGDRQIFMDYHVVSDTGKHFIVDMQSRTRRHVMFDERTLYYTCSTYSDQLPGSLSVLNGQDWYSHLKPGIALQVLDYDSQKVRGIKTHVPDSLVEIVRSNPLKEGQYIKHYILTDEISGQKINHMQLIQIELSRAKATQTFPPTDGWANVIVGLACFVPRTNSPQI